MSAFSQSTSAYSALGGSSPDDAQPRICSSRSSVTLASTRSTLMPSSVRQAVNSSMNCCVSSGSDVSPHPASSTSAAATAAIHLLFMLFPVAVRDVRRRQQPYGRASQHERAQVAERDDPQQRDDRGQRGQLPGRRRRRSGGSVATCPEADQDGAGRSEEQQPHDRNDPVAPDVHRRHHHTPAAMLDHHLATVCLATTLPLGGREKRPELRASRGCRWGWSSDVG
jgi:hypothetical protein